MSKHILLSIMLVFAGFITLSQPYGQHKDASKTGVIKGMVKDASTGKPVEYANIIVKSTQDSSMAGGTVTNAKGQFLVQDLTFGEFQVFANFIGYNKKTITTLRITPKQKSHNLGTVELVQASKELEGVDVVADRNRVEYKIDKKVVNVSQDLTSSGGSAVDALENVPSVQVDIEGNVQLRGSSNFRVLVDGKPTALSGSDALQQIPASTIKNIEIITNPSAKYDPEGTAGIINVITKKQKKLGLNGVVNGSAGLRDKYSGDFLLNYRMGKLNVFGGAEYRRRDMYFDGSSYRENYLSNGDTSYLDQSSERRMQRNGYSVRGGFDYNFSEQSVLSFTAKYGSFGFGWNADTKTHSFASDPAVSDAYYIAADNFNINRNYLNLTLSFNQNFAEKNHKLEASAYLSTAGIEDTDSNKEIPTDADFNTIAMENPLELRSAESGNRLKTRVKVDYTRPLAKGKLEAGYQGRYRNMDEDYTLEQYDPDQTRWNEQSRSDITIYRHIQAAYATYSANFGKLGIMAGIRGEYTDRLLRQQTIDESYRIHRVDIFPSGHLSYKLPANQQVQASYSRRLNRPRGWYLDPLEQYQDRYNIRIGNPELEPEYTNSYELSYQKRFGMSFISLEAFHKNTSNLITRLQEVNDEGIMIHTFGNINNEFSSGAELMVNMEVFKWWRFNASASGYRYQLKGRVNDEDVSRKSTNWDGRINNTFKLPTNTRIQLMGFYRGPSVTAQGERSDFFMTSLAVKQQFLDRAASVTLNMRDVFGTMKHERTSEGANYIMENTFAHAWPMISLSFSYRINNYKNSHKDRNRENEFEGMGGM